MRPEPRHWSSSTSGSSLTSPGSIQVVLDNPIFQEEVKSVIVSFRAMRIPLSWGSLLGRLVRLLRQDHYCMDSRHIAGIECRTS